MLFTFIQKEITDRLHHFQFVFTLITAVFLVCLSTLVLSQSHREREANYRQYVLEDERSLQQVRVFSALNPRVYRPPQPLAIFCSGLTDAFGNEIMIRRDTLPRLEPGPGSDNPFLVIFQGFDLTKIIITVMSLLGLLLAYDAFTREKEQGTLKLMLSGGYPRQAILWGKYLGAMAILALITAVCLLMVLIILTAAQVMNWSWILFLRILLFFILGLLFVSVFYWLGMLISASMKRSASALITGLSVWVFLIILHPKIVQVVISRTVPLPSQKIVEDRLKQEDRDLRLFIGTTLKELAARYHPPGIHPMGFTNPSVIKIHRDGEGYEIESPPRGSDGARIPDPALQQLITFFSEFGSRVEPRRLETAVRKKSIAGERENALKKQKRIMDVLCLSPVSLFRRCAGRLMETDLLSIERFIEKAGLYRESLITYMQSRKAFESKYYASPEQDFTLTDMPRFPRVHAETAPIDTSGTAPLAGTLILMNMLGFIITARLFSRYDPR